MYRGLGKFGAVEHQLAKQSDSFSIPILKDRATPVFIASQNGHRTVLLMLLAEGADPNM